MPHAPGTAPATPRRARLAERISGLKPSLYARIVRRIEAHEGEVFGFHIGESHLAPDAAVLEALHQSAHDRTIHRYASPQGLIPLRDAIAQDLGLRGSPVHPNDVLVVHGATHGLSLACQAVLDPGDEVLVLSPHWPLINGMITTACAVPVEVPFTSAPDGSAPRPEVLASFVTERTRAIYLTSPNNPDGAVLSAEQLDVIAGLCRAHDLYAFVDEAYERFLYVDRPPSLAQRQGMAERTIRIFTFSKTHRMAGLRVGYVVAPPDILGAMTRLSNLSVYNVSLLMQRAALAAMGADAAVSESVAEAARARDQLCAALSSVQGLRFRAPHGGAYVFADLDALLGDRDCEALLDCALDEGVVFSPGEGFGAAYARWARFCFTAMDAEKLARGSDRLAQVFARFRS